MIEFFEICGNFIITYPVQIVTVFIAINIVTAIAYAVDKAKAKNHSYRTPEAVLIGLAYLFGSYGALFGMVAFRHKTKHIKFLIAVPLAFLLQTAFIVLSYINA